MELNSACLFKTWWKHPVTLCEILFSEHNKTMDNSTYLQLSIDRLNFELEILLNQGVFTYFH